jgi:hypothetical protein
MAFPVIGGTQVSGYEIENSLRFNSGDSSKLAFTPSSAVVSERQTFTVSCWVKRGIISTVQYLWEMGGNDNANDRFFARFDASDKLKISDSGTIYRETNRLFRDPSAWYHIVVAVDTTDGTADNRVKVYVNGVQETSFATSNNPGQNDQKGFSDDSEHTIARTGVDNGFSFDGYMADFYAVGGSQLAPTSFGETDDNGVWIPKNYTGSYGTNGFKLEFKQLGTAADATSIGADTSGNDNHFSQTNVTPAVDRTTDTPTNNFATLNSVAPVGSYAEGNLRYTTSTTDGEWSTSTISISTNAKWYCEVKAISKTAGAGIYYQVGVTKGNAADFTYRALYRSDGAIYVGGSNTATFSSYTDNDIISIAYDSSNRNVTFYKNGNSEGTVTAPSLPSTSDDYFFGASSLSGGNTFITEWNFGNAPFTISSGNADANGYGNFEYAVPSGYYALCTKNLAEYG